MESAQRKNLNTIPSIQIRIFPGKDEVCVRVRDYVSVCVCWWGAAGVCLCLCLCLCGCGGGLVDGSCVSAAAIVIAYLVEA